MKTLRVLSLCLRPGRPEEDLKDALFEVRFINASQPPPSCSSPPSPDDAAQLAPSGESFCCSAGEIIQFEIQVPLFYKKTEVKMNIKKENNICTKMKNGV